MSHRKLSTLLTLIFCLLFNTNPGYLTNAQSSQPLMLNIRGDLWVWMGPNAKMQQRTNWGYNQAPILSPNGEQVAYKSTATLAVEAIKRQGGMGGGDLPANIWVLDVGSTNAVRVADQPPDASMLTEPHKYIVRSNPAWSPDGISLAWTELVTDGGTNPPTETLRLVTYSLSQKVAKVVVPNLPAQYGVPSAIDVKWGEPGLAVHSSTLATDSKGSVYGEDTILIFDTEGKQLSSVKVGILTEFTWLKDRGKDYVAAVLNGTIDKPTDPQLVLIEPATGQIVGMTGVPELFSQLAPNGVTMFPASLGTSPDWQMDDPGKPLASLGIIDDVYAFSTVLAISPDGKQVAYIKQGVAYIYSSGQITKLDASDVTAVAWGPTAWRVRTKNTR
jgi:dipeptidyl aminopeptidase/acylaminoacyl peptidase